MRCRFGAPWWPAPRKARLGPPSSRASSPRTNPTQGAPWVGFVRGELARLEGGPRRAFRGAGHHGAPNRHRIGPMAVLLGGQPQKVVSLYLLGIERDRPLERHLGLG